MNKQVIPTRMEMLKIKGKIKLASKGHDLLKMKRDAMIMEFFKILKKARNVREKTNEILGRSFNTLYFVVMNHSMIELKNIAQLSKIEYDLNVKTSNIMGVKIPKITFKITHEEKPFVMKSADIDYLIEQYKDLLRIIVELAEVETTIKKLLKEIEKTKRRVNALEYIILPRLKHQLKEISQRLEEMERDLFVSLKMIKKKI